MAVVVGMPALGVMPVYGKSPSCDKATDRRRLLATALGLVCFRNGTLIHGGETPIR